MKRHNSRSRQQWEAIFDEQARSEMSVKAFCRARAIGMTGFYRWRNLLRCGETISKVAVDSQGSFVEMESLGLPDISEVTSGAESWVVTLDLGDDLKLTFKRG